MEELKKIFPLPLGCSNFSGKFFLFTPVQRISENFTLTHWVKIFTQFLHMGKKFTHKPL